MGVLQSSVPGAFPYRHISGISPSTPSHITLILHLADPRLVLRLTLFLFKTHPSAVRRFFLEKKNKSITTGPYSSSTINTMRFSTSIALIAAVVYGGSGVLAQVSLRFGL